MKNFVNANLVEQPHEALQFFLNGTAEIAGLGIILVNASDEVLFLNENVARWLDVSQQTETLPLLKQLQPTLAKECALLLDDSASRKKRIELLDFQLTRKGLSEPLLCSALCLPIAELTQRSRVPFVLVLAWFREGSSTAPVPNTQDALIRNLISKAPIGILSLNADWECDFANSEVSRLTELSKEELLSRGWTKLFSQHENFLHTLISEVLTQGYAQLELERYSAGHDRVLQLDVKGSINDEGELEHAVCAIIDVTDRVERQQEIHKLANYDSVTGLYNRLAMKHQLERYISLGKRLRQKIQVLFIDLDGFKTINDIYGHAIGDQVLVQAAQRLSRQVRQTDIVARFGGDEFVVIMPGEVPDEVVDNLAGKITAALRHPYLLEEVTLHLSASIGIASFLGDERAEFVADEILLDELMKQADMAMYSAKKNGKNQYIRYSTAHGEAISTAYHISQSLPSAITGEVIRFFYQPIIHNESESVASIEALMRWQDEKMGWMNPELVVDVAEANGLIIDLQHYMLHAVKNNFENLLEKSGGDKDSLRLSVNICAIQLFENKLSQFIADCFASSSFGCQRVTLELTESTLIEDRPEVASNLEYLKEQGFMIALDDFGTGYSSLSYLTKFPIDIVKLDKTFTRELMASSQQAALVKGCIELCHSLDKTVVAEGVETEEEREALLQMGCDYTQGYYYSRPVDAGTLYAWMKKL